MSSCIVHHWSVSIQISIIKITVVSLFPFCLLCVFPVLLVVKTPFRNSPELCPEAGWLCVARCMGGYGQVPPPMGLEIAPEQLQNPKILTECFKKICPDPGNANDLPLALR